MGTSRKTISGNTIRRQAQALGAHVWDAYKKRREELKRQGVSAQDAAQTAYHEVVVPAQRESGPGANTLRGLPTDLPVAFMVARAEFKELEGEPVQNVTWVAQHLPILDVEPADAPSSTAWGLLAWARESPENRKTFWERIYPRLMPSRAQLDREAAFQDDGGDVDEMIATQLEMAQRAMGEIAEPLGEKQHV